MTTNKVSNALLEKHLGSKNVNDKHFQKSGLADLFEMNPNTKNEKLKQYIGKRVRYRKELRGSAVLGTCSINGVWLVTETQLDYRGREILRGYAYPGDFGRPFDPSEIEITDLPLNKGC